MTAQPAYHPAPEPAYDLAAWVDCGCEDGLVRERVGWGATWYAEPPEVKVPCPSCGGNGRHEVRGVLNGAAWADAYPDFAGAGGYLAVLLTATETRVGWLACATDAASWNTTDWHAGWTDRALLRALSVWPMPQGVSR